jgi:hypothetical protein
MSDFRELTNEELKNVQNICSPTTWPQGADLTKKINERFAKLIEIEKIYAEHEGRKPSNLILDDTLPANIAGTTQNDGLHISKAMLANDSNEDRYDSISTVIHEGRHAYQRYCVSQSNNLPENKLTEQVRAWKENENEYIRQDTKSRYMYKCESVERDAYSFEGKQVARIFDKEKEYAQFQTNLNKSIKESQNEATGELGNNYEQKMDCIVRHHYLTGQLFEQVRKELSNKNVPLDKDLINDMKKEYDAYSDIKNQDPQKFKQQQRSLEDKIMRLAGDYNSATTRGA